MTATRKIAIDAMTCESGREVVVTAAREFVSKHKNAEIVLVGQRDNGDNDYRDGIKWEFAEGVALKDEDLKTSLRRENSSTRKTFELVESGAVNAGISFGRTDLVTMLAKDKLVKMKDLAKAPLAAYVPNVNEYGRCLLLDVGACKRNTPLELFQFAIVGEYFARNNGVGSPRVGLLNICTESGRGIDEVVKTDRLLEEYAKKNRNFRYIGFVEGWDVFCSRSSDKVADVIVTDGATGNTMIKAGEGLLNLDKKMQKESFNLNPATKIGGFSWKIGGGKKYVKEKLDPDKYGAAYFLGFENLFIKGHGSASKNAIDTAINAAYRGVSGNEIYCLRESLRASKEIGAFQGLDK